MYWFCPSCAGYIAAGWGCAHPLGCWWGCQEGSLDAGGGDGGHPVRDAGGGDGGHPVPDAGGGDGGHPILRPPALPPQHPEGILLALLETPGPGYMAHTPSPAILPLAQHTPAGGAGLKRLLPWLCSGVSPSLSPPPTRDSQASALRTLPVSVRSWHLFSGPKSKPGQQMEMFVFSSSGNLFLIIELFSWILSYFVHLG